MKRARNKGPSENLLSLPRESGDSHLYDAVLNAPFPVLIVAEDGSIVFLNRLWEEKSGYGQEEVADLFDWAHHCLEEGAHAFARQLSEAFQQEGRTFSGEFPIRSRAGEHLIWDFTIAPLGRLPDGRQALTLSALDVTARRITESALRASEKRFRELFTSSPDAIFLENLEGYILDVNPAGCRLHHADRENLVGSHVRHIIPPEKREKLEDNFDRLKKGEIAHMESESWTLDQQRIPVEIRLTRVEYDDEPAVLLMVRDISARKEAERQVQELNANLEKRVKERTEELAEAYEQLEQAHQDLRRLDELKSVFISVTNHEIRAPLTIVRGIMEILAPNNRSLPRSLKPLLQNLDRATQRLENVVQRAMQTVQDGQYNTKLRLERTHIGPWLDRLTRGLKPFFESRRIALMLELPDTPLHAQLDQEKMADVLENLLMNAIKFSPDESIVKLEVSQKEERILFQVEDRGIGIPLEDQPYIFDSFFTTFDYHHHSSGDFEFCKRGIGLGLAVVKRFTEMHGGCITFESEPDRGSCFLVSLPMDGPNEES